MDFISIPRSRISIRNIAGMIGSGDCNRNGKADILCQNANGQAAVWEMNGLNLISGNNIGSIRAQIGR